MEFINTKLDKLNASIDSALEVAETACLNTAGIWHRYTNADVLGRNLSILFVAAVTAGMVSLLVYSVNSSPKNRHFDGIAQMIYK